MICAPAGQYGLPDGRRWFSLTSIEHTRGRREEERLLVPLQHVSLPVTSARSQCSLRSSGLDDLTVTVLLFNCKSVPC